MSASITAGKIAEKVRDILSGGEAKPEVVPSFRQALYTVQQSRNKVVFDFVWALKREGISTIPHELIDEKKVKAEEYKEGVFRISLKDRVLSGLPNNTGLFQLFTDSSMPQEIIPVPTGFLTMYQRQASFGMGGNPFYIPVKDNLYIHNFKGSECEIILRGVFAGESYGERDFFCITPEMESDIVSVSVKQLMILKEIPEDAVTDNTKN